MHRRNIRLRREYLYRKSLEGKERLLYEKKRKIREALEEGKPIPTELRNEEAALRKKSILKMNYCCCMCYAFAITRLLSIFNDVDAVPRSTIDDEYANAPEKDSKILLTTSRNPSAPRTQFVKELKIVFPNAQRMNRGGQVISEIIETCQSHDFTDVILVHENRGVPDGIVISHLPFGPTAYFGLLNVLGERKVNILKHLFPVPKPDTKRILTFANQSDYISFRHHVYEKHGGPKSIELKEVALDLNYGFTRCQATKPEIKLGTMDQDEAQIEWVIKPYMNTSKKRTLLGD
ncbi:hypothetical protein H5410_057910 [Solanum commersonii]|uniref:Brix domain-containing protein n=1 Tax=Solanum commersonii TaxID=4109 RepID=A0A9J5WS24_SOLCO|nr:hypothetical protein H5410_057910 [Solanum commersonii]